MTGSTGRIFILLPDCLQLCSALVFLSLFIYFFEKNSGVLICSSSIFFFFFLLFGLYCCCGASSAERSGAEGANLLA